MRNYVQKSFASIRLTRVSLLRRFCIGVYTYKLMRYQEIRCKCVSVYSDGMLFYIQFTQILSNFLKNIFHLPSQNRSSGFKMFNKTCKVIPMRQTDNHYITSHFFFYFISSEKDRYIFFF